MPSKHYSQLREQPGALVSRCALSLLELRQVSKDYHIGETRIAALKEINLVIQKGEFVAIWGPSGSGNRHLTIFKRGRVSRSCG